MELKTELRKARDGWRAETNVPLEDGRTLKLSTWKGNRRSGGVETHGTVVKDDGNGMFSYVLFQDYSKTVYSAAGKATEKLVRDTHAMALTQLPSIIEEVKAFYATKKEAA